MIKYTKYSSCDKIQSQNNQIPVFVYFKCIIHEQIVEEEIRKEQSLAKANSSTLSEPSLNDVNTDDENDENEYESWKLRELKRIKRDREEREL